MWGGVISVATPYGERLKLLQKAKIRAKKGAFVVSTIETVKPSAYRKFLLMQGDKALEGLVMKRLDAKDFWNLKATQDVGSQLKYRF